MPELKAGDKLLYVASADYWHDTDGRGQPVFSFVHVVDGPVSALGRLRQRPLAGEPLQCPLSDLGPIERRDDSGNLHTARGFVIKPHRPLVAWPAVVREETWNSYRREMVTFQGAEIEALVPEVNRRLVLDVSHPNGHTLLHLPLEGLAAVKHDAAKGLHTYHLSEEA